MTNRFRIGILATDDPTQIIPLRAGAEATKYDALLDVSGNAYQVPAGYFLTIVQLCISSPNAAHGVQLMYGDTAVTNSSSAPTNPVTLLATYYNPTTNLTAEFSVKCVIPSSKYLHAYATGGTSLVTCYGFLTANP